jgi:NitT/TauT family transport system ATP-binding protein
MGFLNLSCVEYAYPQQGKVVDGVSLELKPGEIHCLVGRSGCGKTTVLKLAAGLLRPLKGEIRLQQHNVTEPKIEMGFVFQSPTLLNWLSVLDNVLLPVSLHRTITSTDHAHATKLLEQMGLTEKTDHRPHHLSGGQQSRVAIARALITQPQILFMDEPFASLDAITREELQSEFLNICKAQGTAALFVTHDMNEAVYLADQVSLMHKGRIESQLHIDLDRPRPNRVRYTPHFNALCEKLQRNMETLT